MASFTISTAVVAGEPYFMTGSEIGTITSSGSLTFSSGSIFLSSTLTNAQLNIAGSLSAGFSAVSWNGAATGQWSLTLAAGALINSAGIAISGATPATVATTLDLAGTITATNPYAIFLSAGNDVVIMRSGVSVGGSMFAGAGTDLLDYSFYGSAVTATLGGAFTGGSAGNAAEAFENLTGSAFADTLTGDGNANTLIGGAENDTLQGAGGNDTLDGGAGDDSLNGGAGIDTATYESAGAGVVVRLGSTLAQNTGGAGIDRLADIENLTGSGAGDTLTGNLGANILLGLAGNDTLDGGSGDDTLDGGADSDTASYVSALAAVTVSLALQGAAQNTGGAGSDRLTNFENLLGSAFNDVLTGDTHANTISGGAQNDTLNGADGNDTLDGGADQDSLAGGLGNDTLLGGVGNDTLDGGEGADRLDGGADIDTASFAGAGSAVIANLQSGTAVIGSTGDTLVSIENLLGTAFNDLLVGDDNANVIEGGAGDDNMLGGAGIDTASYAGATAGVTVSLGISVPQDTGGAGNDVLTDFETLLGSGFADTLTGEAGVNVLAGGADNDTLDGAGGNDTLQGGADDDVLIGGAGADALDGGTGRNTASYASAGTGVVAMLAAPGANQGDAQGDSYTNIQDLLGSGFADTLAGDANANILAAGAGNDAIDGGEGNDTLRGEADDDTLSGGAGNDSLDGGAGTDTAIYNGSPAGVTVSLAIATAQDTGGAGTDTLASIENLTGSGFADTLTGDGGANTLSGTAGNDTLTGGAGNDALLGGTGLDAAVAAGARASATLTKNAGAGWTVSGPDGTDTLLGIERLRFDDATVNLAVARPHDMTGRAFADLLWTSANGLYLWQQEGAVSVARGGGVGGVGAGWTLAGRGDLSGDGRSDLVWSDASGNLWGQISGGTNGSIATLAAGQSLAGVGDTDGDGKADLVQIAAGVVTIRRMDGTATLSTAATTFNSQAMAALGGEWSVAAVADFNADLKADILWRNAATGDLYIWRMDGAAVTGQAALGRPGMDWTVAGAGDLNGDGRADVALRDAATGDVWGLLLNGAGTAVASQGWIGRAGAGWTPGAVADFTGDDKADLVWTDAAHNVLLWQMDGLTLSAQTAAGSAGAGWSLL